MLKKIPKILSPELVRVMMEMGHGDELVISDGNFPAASMANNLVRLDGNNVPEVLDAILSVLPLDQYVEMPVAYMDVVPGDDFVPVIWDEYQKIFDKYEPDVKIEHMERFAFYERAKKVYLSVYTGEEKPYGNIILKKGVVLSD